QRTQRPHATAHPATPAPGPTTDGRAKKRTSTNDRHEQLRAPARTSINQHTAHEPGRRIVGVLKNIERRLQGAVDYAFTRLFGGGVQPAEVTIALQNEATGHLQRQGTRTVAPNRYVVRLGPSDAATVGGDTARVEAAFSGIIDRYVREQGWDTFGEIAVTLDESDMLHTGQFRVHALIAPDAHSRPPIDRAGAPEMTHSAGNGQDPQQAGWQNPPPAHWPEPQPYQQQPHQAPQYPPP